VAPEREHLVGWAGAESEEEAAERSHFVCPACSEPWTEENRIVAGRDAVLLHRGQTITKRGKIKGDIPKTQTLGFRWSAIDNPFVTASDLGAEEWKASKDRDRENAEKKMRQFVWALPYEPPELDLTPLLAEDVEKRTGKLKKGVVPAETTAITIGIDTGKRALHWTALAASKEHGSRVIEYGEQPVAADRLGVRRGLVDALIKLAEYFDDGWADPSGRVHFVSQVWIDSGYHEHTEAVYEFCTLINKKLECPLGAEIYRPTKGYGEGQKRMTRYNAPTGKNRGILHIGNQFHIARVQRNGRFVPGVMLVHMNSDHWKSELHQRLSMPAEDELAVTLYDAASPNEHADFSEQLTAEKQVEKFLPNRGEVVVWERVRRKNHWLDSTYSALCAGEAIIEVAEKATKKKRKRTLQEMAKEAK
jgi:hypothetical protein